MTDDIREKFIQLVRDEYNLVNELFKYEASLRSSGIPIGHFRYDEAHRNLVSRLMNTKKKMMPFLEDSKQEKEDG